MSLLIAFIIFLIAGCCTLKWYDFMIQPGAMLDIVFGYQKMLNSLYNGSKTQQLLGKVLGDCKMCMSFWFGVLWFWFFYGFCKFYLNIWVTDRVNSLFSISFLNITAFTVFQSTCSMLCFFMLTKMLKK